MVISIDLGSNTLRIAQIRSDRCGARVVKSFERIVGSAKNLALTGVIGREAVEKIFRALSEARGEFDFSAYPVVAVATQAFRIARNSDEIFSEISRVFGIKFQVITAGAEAKFTLLGVQNALTRLKFNARDFALIDLGGASTEIADERNFKSFTFGIVTFFDECAGNYETMRTRAKDIVCEGRAFLDVLGRKNLALTSGVPTSAAAMKLDMNYANYDAAKINGTRLELGDFDEIREQLLKASDERADELVGAGRKMQIIAGITLLKELLTPGNFNLVVVDDGLREGVGAAFLKQKFSEILKS